MARVTLASPAGEGGRAAPGPPRARSTGPGQGPGPLTHRGRLAEPGAHGAGEHGQAAGREHVILYTGNGQLSKKKHLKVGPALSEARYQPI